MLVLPILELLIKEITHYVLFCVGIFFYSTQCFLNIKFKNSYCCLMNSSLFIPSPVEGHLGRVRFGAITSKAALGICVQVCL